MLDKTQENKNKERKIILLSQIKSDKKNYSRKGTIPKSEEGRNFRYELGLNKISNTNDEKIGNNLSKLDSMILYKDKIKNFQKKKDYSSSDMLTCSADCNDKTNDSRCFVNMKMKAKMNSASKGSSMLSKIIGLSNIKVKKKKAKKVTFKKNFVTYVDIESFKKYNMENFCFNANDKIEEKCTCFIF